MTFVGHNSDQNRPAGLEGSRRRLLENMYVVSPSRY